MENYLENRIIQDKRYLDDEQLGPDEKACILRDLFAANIREKEFQKLNQHFAPIFADNHPFHLCIYGKPGTGKTVSTKIFCEVLSELCESKNIACKIIQLNCTTPKTPFQFLNDFACELNVSRKYRKGVAHEEFMNKAIDALKEFTGYLIVLVDEINNIKYDSGTIFQFLIRRLPTEINSKLILILISNKLDWTDNLDPRVSSFFKKEDLYFRPYNAVDLLAILKLRVEKSLNKDMVEDGVIEKIAAYSSREHGDARKAVALLAKAAQMAEEKNSKITIDCVDLAESAIDKDKYIEAAETLPRQIQLAFLSIYSSATISNNVVCTGQGYEVYQKLAREHGVNPITQRRYSDCLKELDLTGLITMRIISKGRYGRTAEISLPMKDIIMNKVSERIESSLKTR